MNVSTFWIGTIEHYIVTECSCTSFLTVSFSLQNRQCTTTPEIRLFTCNHKLMLQHQTIQHHPPLFVSKLCEWMWAYFEYCALLLWVLWVEWTLSLVSVVGRHLGSGRMSSGFIYTGCSTYSCGNWTMRKTMRTIMSIWQQVTQNTKQHHIKKSCHPFLAYKHPLVL